MRLTFFGRRLQRASTGALALVCIEGCEIGAAVDDDAFVRASAPSRAGEVDIPRDDVAAPAREAPSRPEPCPELADRPVVKASSMPEACVGNPCNPACYAFFESLDGGVVNSPSAPAPLEWAEGKLDDFPMGLVKKGRVEPCSTGADCQFNSQCVGPVSGSCSHDKCREGEALERGCDACVDEVCDLAPECCTEEWDATCVRAAEEACDVSCNKLGTGSCVPWVPGETEPACSGIDLAVAPVCDDVVPVCNHGSDTAPAGLRIVHFPGNSMQYPLCDPDQSHPQMEECFTSEPIAPGACIEVRDCDGLNGNREIMVNPPDPSGATETYFVPECSCRDNWSLRSNNVECQPSACELATVETPFRDTCSFRMPGKGGRSPSRSKLGLKRGSGPATPLDLVPDPSVCGGRDGWFVDEAADDDQLTLCPATCRTLSGEADAVIETELSCAAGGYEVVTFQEAYQGECPIDQAVQWGFLTYEVETPGDSSVTLRLRHGRTPEEMMSAEWLDVTTASAAAGNESCGYFGPDPCPIDVFELLGGTPNAHSRHVQLMTTATPTSDGTQAPVIHHWGLTFSCLPEY